MEIIIKDISSIRPYEKNPRLNDSAVQYVANSIKEFGFKQPIVIDGSGVIVAGHTRYKAARQIGLKDIPCVIADDLTDEQIKAYRLADNKTAEYSQWDIDLLDLEILEIKELINLEKYGFDLSEPEALDLDDNNDKKENDNKTFIHCPKCGFEFYTDE